MADLSQQYMFENLKKPRNLTQYKLMQGVTDFGNLSQWNLYESGYSFLKVISVPRYVQMLADSNSDTKALLENYKHILEYEFRGLDGLDNITSETFELTNGISNINVISKTIMQSASTVSMRFFEKSGSPITRMHELFLTGIKDPRTLVKTYHGLIAAGKIEAGYENEIFSFLYFVTDNTATEIEKAYLLVAAQPTTAELNIYNSEKGTVEQKEITAEFNCFPITGALVNAKAKATLDWMNSDDNPDKLVTQYDNYKYTGIDDIDPKADSINVTT